MGDNSGDIELPPTGTSLGSPQWGTALGMKICLPWGHVPSPRVPTDMSPRGSQCHPHVPVSHHPTATSPEGFKDVLKKMEVPPPGCPKRLMTPTSCPRDPTVMSPRGPVTPCPYRSHDVGDVGHGCPRGSAQVEDLRPRADVDLVDATEDGGRQLGAEGVPGTVLHLGVTVLGTGTSGDMSPPSCDTPWTPAPPQCHQCRLPVLPVWSLKRSWRSAPPWCRPPGNRDAK